jgi:hypothetical protein
VGAAEEHAQRMCNVSYVFTSAHARMHRHHASAALSVDSSSRRRGRNISIYIRSAHMARPLLACHRTTRPYHHGDGGLVISAPWLAVAADVSESHVWRQSAFIRLSSSRRRGLTISKYVGGAHLARPLLACHRTTRPYCHGDGGLVINPPCGWLWRPMPRSLICGICANRR